MKWVSNTDDKIFLYDDHQIDSSLTSTQGEHTGAVIQTTSAEVQLFVGISYVSIKNAKHNLETEVPSLIWYVVRDESLLTWEN